MKKKAGKKDKPVVCVICKGDRKIKAKQKCCSPEMTAKEKGSWNI